MDFDEYITDWLKSKETRQIMGHYSTFDEAQIEASDSDSTSYRDFRIVCVKCEPDDVLGDCIDNWQAIRDHLKEKHPEIVFPEWFKKRD